MKPFNLQEYLRNPSRKVVTRDGHPVRIICTDAKGGYPIIGLKEDDGIERALSYLRDGTFNVDTSSKYDLFFETKKKKGWINLYQNSFYGRMAIGYVCETKEEALKHIGGENNSCEYIGTIQIEWEE